MRSNIKRRVIILIAAFMGMVEVANAFYDPGLQRWINRDPIAEDGGINLFNFVYNQPTYYADTDGRLPIIIPILIIIGGGTLYANAPGPDDPHYGGMPYAETAMDLFPGTRGTKIGCNVGKKLIGAADNVAESLGKTVATELTEKATREALEQAARQAKKLSESELKKYWGKNIHETKDLIKQQYKKELKKIDTTNPDMALDPNGKLVLQNPTDPTKCVPTGLPPESFAP